MHCMQPTIWRAGCACQVRFLDGFESLCSLKFSGRSSGDVFPFRCLPSTLQQDQHLHARLPRKCIAVLIANTQY